MARSEALGRVKAGYTTGVRRIAARSMSRLARSRVTPNALTAAGVLLCTAGAIVVYFEDRNELAAFWVGAALFIVGSILDILDGALARTSGKATPFGAFVDSMTDRVSEGVMLASIALIFMREGNQVALAFTFAAAVGSFLVSYARAKAEILGPARRRRSRQPCRARGRHLRGVDPRSVGRAPVGDLPAGRDCMADRDPAAPPRAATARGIACSANLL